MSPTYIENIILAVVLFSGFTWLRMRARRSLAEGSHMPILMGIFIVLPAFLLAEAKLLPLLPFKGWPLFALKIGLLSVTFYGIGRFFIKPAP